MQFPLEQSFHHTNNVIFFFNPFELLNLSKPVWDLWVFIWAVAHARHMSSPAVWKQKTQTLSQTRSQRWSCPQGTCEPLASGPWPLFPIEGVGFSHLPPVEPSTIAVLHWASPWKIRIFRNALEGRRGSLAICTIAKRAEYICSLFCKTCSHGKGLLA